MQHQANRNLSPWAKCLYELFKLKPDANHNASTDKPTLEQFIRAFGLATDFATSDYFELDKPTVLNVLTHRNTPIENARCIIDKPLKQDSNALELDKIFTELLTRFAFLLESESLQAIEYLYTINPQETKQIITGEGEDVNMDAFKLDQYNKALSDFESSISTFSSNLTRIRLLLKKLDNNEIQKTIAPGSIIPLIISQRSLRQLLGYLAKDNALVNKMNTIQALQLINQETFKTLDQYINQHLGEFLNEQCRLWYLDIERRVNDAKFSQGDKLRLIDEMNEYLLAHLETTISFSLIAKEEERDKIVSACIKRAEFILKDTAYHLNVNDAIKSQVEAKRQFQAVPNASDCGLYKHFVHAEKEMIKESLFQKFTRLISFLSNEPEITPSEPTFKAQHKSLQSPFNQFIVQIGLIKDEFTQSRKNLTASTVDNNLKDSLIQQWDVIINKSEKLISQAQGFMSSPQYKEKLYQLLHEHEYHLILNTLQARIAQNKSKISDEKIFNLLNEAVNNACKGVFDLKSNYIENEEVEIAKADDNNNTGDEQEKLDTDNKQQDKSTANEAFERAAQNIPEPITPRKKSTIASDDEETEEIDTATLDDILAASRARTKNRHHKKHKHRTRSSSRSGSGSHSQSHSRSNSKSRSRGDSTPTTPRYTPHLKGKIEVLPKTPIARKIMETIFLKLEPAPEEVADMPEFGVHSSQRRADKILLPNTQHSDDSLDHKVNSHAAEHMKIADSNAIVRSSSQTTGIQLFHQNPRSEFYIRYWSPLDLEAKNQFIASIDRKFEKSLRHLLMAHNDLSEPVAKRYANDLTKRDIYFPNILRSEIVRKMNEKLEFDNNHEDAFSTNNIIVRKDTIGFQITPTQEVLFKQIFGLGMALKI